MSKSTAHRDSFVVRIWWEQGQPGWTGWVQHARTGESTIVQSPAELLVFIERWTGKLIDTPRKGVK